jgi:hypothetical protein
MIWSVSCAIRDRLIRHRDAEAERQATAKREERLAEAVEVEVMRVSVSADVERVAKRILRKVMVADDAFESVKAYRIKKDFGRDKPFFDVALTHAKRMDWITQEEGSGDLRPGASRPSE